MSIGGSVELENTRDLHNSPNLKSAGKYHSNHSFIHPSSIQLYIFYCYYNMYLIVVCMVLVIFMGNCGNQLQLEVCNVYLHFITWIVVPYRGRI